MKKQLNIALLPAAVAAALLSGNVMAGTESCFENWSNTETSWANTSDAASYAKTKYALADCKAEGAMAGTADFASAGDHLLAKLDSNNRPTSNAQIAIARELAVSRGIDLDSSVTPAAGDSKAATDFNLTYIPTTDIPGGSYINMSLAGATFGSLNNNQIFLLGFNTTDNDWEVLATTDGTVNDQNEIKFVTQSGSPIGAGTRMIMSSNNSVPTPIKFEVDNKVCDLGDTNITLKVDSVVTSGNQQIAGGAGATAVVAVIKQQFEVKVTTAKDDVDAANESASRELFETGKAYSKGNFYVADANGTGGYAQWIAVNQNDLDLEITPEFTANAGDGVKFYLVNDNNDAGSNATNALVLDADGNKTVVPDGSVKYTLSNQAGVVQVAELFNSTTQPAFVIENIQADGKRAPMNFNYNTALKTKITFGGAAGFLAGCDINKVSHDIGVNGAVLKVPYMRTVGQDQWIKITNESNKEASVLLDVFNDKATAEEANGVVLGTVAAKETKLYYGSDLLEAAVAAGYGAGNESTHTMTFVVTAPESSVHGVSVQTVPGKGDRVQPVLRASSEVVGYDLNASGSINSLDIEAKAWKW